MRDSPVSCGFKIKELITIKNIYLFVMRPPKNYGLNNIYFMIEGKRIESMDEAVHKLSMTER